MRQLGTACRVLAISLVLGGCGQPIDGLDTGATATDLPSSDAPIETLASVFASCSEPPDLAAEAFSFIAATQGWIRVTAVLGADRRPEGDAPTPTAVVRVAEAKGTGEALEGAEQGVVDAVVHSSYWKGIDWALSKSADVWLALADPAWVDMDNMVSFVLIVLPDGRVVFPGDCQHQILYMPLERALGERMDSTLRTAAGRVGEDLSEALRAGLADDADS